MDSILPMLRPDRGRLTSTFITSTDIKVPVLSNGR